MKKVLLITLACLPFLSNAQDWHGVPVGQHNIYRVSNQSTFLVQNWNNYVRNIYVESVSPSSNHIRHNFYLSIRKDENDVFDTLTGPTWLGRYNIRYHNGDEIYFNKYLDTILLKTHAALNQSWLLGQDTTGNRIFMASVAALDTMTIDGVQDSIKVISIQALNGSTPTASVYNNYEIVLSKAHGFYKTLDFYGFPNYDTNNYYFADEIYPILPYQHIRLDDTVTNINYDATNLVHHYQAGNEWIIAYNGYQPNYAHDSVISATIMNPNSVVVTLKKDTLAWHMISNAPPAWQQVYTTGIYTDTISTSPTNYSRTLKTDSLENQLFINSIYNNIAFSGNWTFFDTLCSDQIHVYDSSAFNTALSGYQRKARHYYKDTYYKQGIYHDWYSTGTNVYYAYYADLIYSNINGCQTGTYFSLRPTSTKNYFLKSDVFKLYPNPTATDLYLQTDEDWNKLEIISMQGQTVMNFDKNHGSQFSLANLPSGLYMVKIKTDAGNYLQKILKK